MKTFSRFLFCWLAMALLAGGLRANADTITSQPWGVAFGQPVRLFTLTNSRGMVVRISNYGAILQSIYTPDRYGHKADIILGFNNVAQYVKSSPYFGAIVGRYANRIAKGRFTLDGKTYQLYINNGPNSLHGGKRGFDKRIWTPMPIHMPGGVGLAMHLVSPNGQEHYPGRLSVTVVYTLEDNNSLKIDYRATTNQDTVLNLSNHAYWNLNGAGNGTVLGQYMMINANKYTPVDATSIPLGYNASVTGTPMDFRFPHTIGSRIMEHNQQIKNVGGYDFNWVLNQPGPANHPAKDMILACRVYSKQSGRVLSIYTDQPGLQFYSGNFLDGTLHGNGGTYLHRGAFVLETQHYPDSPNEPSFPTTELKPGQVFHYTTIERFSTR